MRQASYRLSRVNHLATKRVKYNVEHQTEIRQRQSVYNRNHKQHIVGKQTLYNAKHKVHIVRKQALYNAKHKVHIVRKQALYNGKHREQIARKQALYDSNNIDRIRKRQLARRRENASQAVRLNDFQDEVRCGPIYPCSSCHRLLFTAGVKKLTAKLKSKANTNNAMYDQTVQEIRAPDNELYLCHTCLKWLCSGKCPPMSTANGLMIDKTPPEIELSELESMLIAKKILFIKIFKLPKSRWSALSDRVINVPINDNDLLNTLSTVTSLPRSIDGAGLIPIKLKRKVQYKNFVLEAYVDPEKVIEAVRKLKELGHPGYRDVEISSAFKKPVS